MITTDYFTNREDVAAPSMGPATCLSSPLAFQVGRTLWQGAVQCCQNLTLKFAFYHGKIDAVAPLKSVVQVLLCFQRQSSMWYSTVHIGLYCMQALTKSCWYIKSYISTSCLPF